MKQLLLSMCGLFLVGETYAAPPVSSTTAIVAPALRMAADSPESSRFELLGMFPLTTNVAETKLVILCEEGAVEQVIRDIEMLGSDVQIVLGSDIQVLATWDQIGDIANVDGVMRLSVPRVATAKEATSEGVDAMFANSDWHDQGLTGRGVRVGIVDIGFDGYKSLLGGELPDSVNVDGLRDDWDYDNHGTAVAEIIHDVAPEAELFFYSFETEMEYRNLILSLADSGEVDIVNASIGFDNVWHADGTSPYAQVVDELEASGVFYVAASGNEGGSYVSGDLTDVDGNGWIEINGDEGIWIATSGWGEELWADVTFRWSEPIGAAEIDLDLTVTDEYEEFLCGVSEDPQAGNHPPIEWVSCEANDDWMLVWISVWENASVEGLRGWLYSGPGVDDSQATYSETLTLPADAEGAFSVGAYYPSSEELAWYSSQGPTNDGRMKPEVVAPAGISTVTYGPMSAEGTSFAAPHVAGLAALILEQRPRYSPEKVRNYLIESAHDLGAAGPDNEFGHGAVLAAGKPSGCGCNSGTPRGGLALLALAMVAMLRRSKSVVRVAVPLAVRR